MIPLCFRTTHWTITLQRLSPTHDLLDLVGDGCLMRLVVGQFQVFQKGIGIVGGLVHGGHAGAVFAGVAIE